MKSTVDSRGKVWIACSECERGGNGTDPDKCSSGWRIKRFNGSGCFCGEPVPEVKKLIEEEIAKC